MRSLLSIGVLIVPMSLVGCAMPRFVSPTGPDAAGLRGERRAHAIEQFETHRDTAQFQAAMDRWRTGDSITCESQLRALVARKPNHLEARRALADLALERGDDAAAEQELRAALAIVPDDAPTHHALGLLLESSGRGGEADQHFRRAATLEPANALFQLTAPTAARQ
jgi:predicted Zn-dependent protease